MIRKVILGLFLACALVVSADAAVPASVTVQGKLTDAGGVPLSSGAKNFIFKVFDASSGGTEVWPAGPGENQTISSGTDGLWIGMVGAMIPLNDVVFRDTVRWLEITVDGTTLPRVRLVTGPYAFRVETVDGASGGTITSKVSIGPFHTNTGVNAFVAGEENSATNSFATVSGGLNNTASGYGSAIGGGTGNTAGPADLASVNGGSANTASGVSAHVSGGQNNRARGDRAAIVGGGGPSAADSNAAIGDWTFIGGGRANLASDTGSVVAGGGNNKARGRYSFVGGGGGSNDADSNSASGFRSAVVAGARNTADDDNAFVGAGSGNVAGEQNSFVGAGTLNLASGSLGGQAVVAGDQNQATGFLAGVVAGRNNVARGGLSFIGSGGQGNIGLGGDSNAAIGYASAIVCGVGNTAGSASSDSCAFVGNGRDNTAGGRFSTISGGRSNSANGFFSTIPGGNSNTAAGRFAFAAGRRAKADNDGCFVWGDSTNGDFASSGVNQFLIRAAGGVGIGTDTPEGPLHVLESSAGTVTANSSSSGIFERNATNYISILSPDANARGILFGEPSNTAAGAIIYNTAGVLDGLDFRAGGNISRMTLDAAGNLTVDGCVDGNNTACISDRRFKKDIEPLDDALATVEKLCGISYSWRRDEFPDRSFEAGRQMGLIAQDVQEVLPGSVRERSDGYLSIEYNSLVPLLVEAIKEQQKQIEELKAALNSMTP